MSKQKQSTPNPPAEPEQPRPTQTAIKPASGKEIWGMFGVGILCLLGFLMGLGYWLNSTIAAELESVDVRNSMMPVLLPFIFPIFLPMAIYAWWSSWHDWRQTRVFTRNRQITTGVITHLWIDPPRPPGKKYYVGYQFNQSQSAYQQVQARTYNRLSVGQTVTVEYAATDPRLSCLDLQKRAKKQAA